MTDIPHQPTDEAALEDEVVPAAPEPQQDATDPDGVEGEAEAAGLPDGLGDAATGDIVIDSALLDLRDAPADDLDAQVEAGQQVHRTLQARLSDLGGE